ncbi:MAG: aldehyde dehydrogenase family protein [Bacteroidota bacterium]
MSSEAVALIVDGQAVTTGRVFPVVDPATEELIAEVADADEGVVRGALAAAEAAFPGWSQTAPGERKAAVLRYIGLLERDRARLAELLVREAGKPYDTADYEVTCLIGSLRYFLEEADRLRQDVIVDPTGRFLHYTLRQPLGVVVGFLAWNYPLLNLGYKLGPVLASGCTAVIKPSRHTPLATLAAAELLVEAGIPDGVVNVIACEDRAAADLLLKSPVPSMITMIGSTASGVKLIETAATTIKHFSLELGGNAPAIVYPDADLADAAVRIANLKFSNCGQVCVAPNRALVHADVYEEFLALAAERAAAFKLGSGKTEGPLMGPLMTAEGREKALAAVSEAVAEGAKIVCGGRKPEQPARGYFIQPTILRDVRPEMKIAQQELFAPLLPVIRYTDDDDVLAMANDTPYGLAAYVFTTDLSTALRAGERLEAGSICINEPHFGVHLPHAGLKQSGVGLDRSPYSLEEYLTIKRVSIRK